MVLVPVSRCSLVFYISSVIILNIIAFSHQEEYNSAVVKRPFGGGSFTRYLSVHRPGPSPRHAHKRNPQSASSRTPDDDYFDELSYGYSKFKRPFGPSTFSFQRRPPTKREYTVKRPFGPGVIAWPPPQPARERDGLNTWPLALEARSVVKRPFGSGVFTKDRQSGGRGSLMWRYRRQHPNDDRWNSDEFDDDYGPPPESHFRNSIPRQEESELENEEPWDLTAENSEFIFDSPLNIEDGKEPSPENDQ